MSFEASRIRSRPKDGERAAGPRGSRIVPQRAAGSDSSITAPEILTSTRYGPVIGASGVPLDLRTPTYHPHMGNGRMERMERMMERILQQNLQQQDVPSSRDFRWEEYIPIINGKHARNS